MALPPEYLNHIDGQWCPASTSETFPDINPADTRDIVALFPASSEEDARHAVAAAARAFPSWRATPMAQRAKVLLAAASHLEEHAETFALELTREEGKPLSAATQEFRRAAQTLRFYAIEAQTFGGETFPSDDAGTLVYSVREPLGVVTVITPWNFPVSIPARKIAPALMTGNTVVFKPASDAPLSGFRLAEALILSGLPAGVLNFITGSARDIGPVITQAPEVRAITFTGSTAAGERIHRSAGLTTRTQMELGGKNPLIVMDDADLDRAVDLSIKGGLSLSGQACTGTSRIIVIASVKDDFVARLKSRVERLKIGNGQTPGMDLGPLATRQQLDTVLSYIAIGHEEATWVCGGEQLAEGEFAQGYYVRPAVFSDVTMQMRIAREEIFGPVLCVIEAKDYADAMAKANDTEYGLSAGIVTNRPGDIQRFTRDIEAGTVKVNRTTTGNLVNAPFGGLKHSSTSTFRESGRVGLEFFTQTKIVYLGD